MAPFRLVFSTEAQEGQEEVRLPGDGRQRPPKAVFTALGLICHGHAQNRGPGAGGPCYQWIRKEKGKPVSVAMSAEQYEAMAAVIANWKKAKEILRRMEQTSRRIIFATLPDTRRSKPLTDEVLGLS